MIYDTYNIYIYIYILIKYIKITLKKYSENSIKMIMDLKDKKSLVMIGLVTMILVECVLMLYKGLDK